MRQYFPTARNLQANAKAASHQLLYAAQHAMHITEVSFLQTIATHYSTSCGMLNVEGTEQASHSLNKDTALGPDTVPPILHKVFVAMLDFGQSAALSIIPFNNAFVQTQICIWRCKPQEHTLDFPDNQNCGKADCITICAAALLHSSTRAQPLRSYAKRIFETIWHSWCSLGCAYLWNN